VLTGKGRSAFASVNRRSGEEVSATISSVGARGQEELVRAMRAIESLLEPAASRKTFRLREPRPGDYGWIVHRHGALYAQEYGWDETFEAMVAGLVARFVERFKPGRERCWIAEGDGEFVGCVFLVERSRTVAQLRMLLVEPGARGMGVGSELVRQSIAFARAAGYARMMLWTNDILHSARRIYERAGFRLTSEERHVSFGRRLMGQNWRLELEARGK
jgi:GNAT superfamily N-acetyltransferase